MSRIEAGLRRAIELTAQGEPDGAGAQPGESSSQPAFADEFRFTETEPGEAIDPVLVDPVLVPTQVPRAVETVDAPPMRVRRGADDKLIVSSDITPLALEQ